ncbi:MAG: histidine-type phosphatase [Dyella sp.]
MIVGLCIIAIAPATAAPTLRMEIVLMRHGVRAPTSEPAKLAAYADQPWPTWPVAAGMLTAHGAQGMQALGARYRADYRTAGVLGASCAELSVLQVIADSTPRNRASAAALLRGLAPDCGLHFQGLPVTESNPLFHWEHDDADDDGAAAPAIAAAPDELAQLQRVLLGCNDGACLQRAAAEGKHVLLMPAHSGDPVALAKAMKIAGTMSENVMLEYAQGLPLAQVAWGRVTPAAVSRLVTLHNLSFELTKRSLPAAAQGGSNLLAHILATLQAAAGEMPAVQPLASADTRVLLLLGHDTNLAHLAGLLGVDWHRSTDPDDYPPGGALVFQLWEQDGRYRVNLLTRMPTLQALRSGDFRPRSALSQRDVSLPAWAGGQGYPLAAFLAAARARMDDRFVDAKAPALTVQSDP